MNHPVERTFTFICLLVDSTGERLGPPFVARIPDDPSHYVSELGQVIKKIRPDIPLGVPACSLTLWNPNSFEIYPDTPNNQLDQRVKDLFNVSDGERDAKQLDPLERLADAFPLVPPHRLHIIAQLPSNKIKPDNYALQATSAFPTDLEDEITFTIPDARCFLNLKKSDISADEVEDASSRDVPTFVQDFRDALMRPRLVSSDSPLVAALSKLLPRHGESFGDYFRDRVPPSLSPEDRVVTEREIGQYLHVLICNDIFKVEKFQDNEGQIGAIFLRTLAGESRRHLRNTRAEFRTPWPFPLVVSPREGDLKHRYTPINDFRLQIRGFPHLILELYSGQEDALENQSGLWRMVLQASCLARLGNKLRRGTSDPVVIMAIYIDSELEAHELLVYQPDGSKKALYHETVFDLTFPKMAFIFMFRLYNFLSRASEDDLELQDFLFNKLHKMAEVPKDQYPLLTSGRKRKRGPDGDGVDSATHSPGSENAGGEAFEDPSVQEAIEAAGYLLEVIEMLEPLTPLGPRTRTATASDGSKVILKLVHDDTDEPAILKYLNEIRSAANHTIELRGVIDSSIAKLIALPCEIALDEYLRCWNPPQSATSFPAQFLEGVAFLHEHKVAHLDLKPANVVVDSRNCDESSPRLLIIDFGLSVFVEDERTTVEGYCGTPPWVAPEVGTRDGPEMVYSAILADRWACGRVIDHLNKHLPVGGPERVPDTLKERLLSDDPRSRPSLKEVLEACRDNERRGVKRSTMAIESDAAQKQARLGSVNQLEVANETELPVGDAGNTMHGGASL